MEPPGSRDGSRKEQEMKSRKLLIVAAVAAFGLIGIGGGAALAAAGQAPTPGAHWAMGPGGGGHGPGPGVTTDGTVGPYHDQIHQAAADALGITVQDLDARLAAGETMYEIADSLGVSFNTVQTAMQSAQPRIGGRGGMQRGFGGYGGDCPYTS